MNEVRVGMVGVVVCVVSSLSSKRNIVKKLLNATKEVEQSSPMSEANGLATSMTNQCDGCQAGLPTYPGWSGTMLHRYPIGGVAACTKEVYEVIFVDKD